MLSIGNLFSQESYMLAYEKEGDAAMEKGEYDKALEYYKVSRRFFTTPLRLYYKMGEASRVSLNYDKAEFYYQKLIRENDSLNLIREFPMLYFNLSDVSISNGNIFIAQGLLEEFIEQTKDSLAINLAKKKLKSIEWIIKNNDPIHGTDIINLGENVNNESFQTSNFVLGDSILYISNIDYIITEKNGIEYYTNVYQKIYTTNIDSNKNHSPIKQLNIKEINKKKRNISNICFDTSNMRAYFTRCSSLNNSICYIYYSTFENGKYQRAKKLNKEINLRGYSNTQPHIGIENGQKVLYFSSNRKGGYGGYDLYYYILDGKDNKAVNLGPTINTEGDEICPFYSPIDKSLYFSSNSHYGFGGFDIFRSEGWASRWREVENLMQPINSPANEVYPIILIPEKKGYFTSNREGSFSSENRTCCNDIYRFEIDDSVPEIPTMETIKNKSKFSPLFDLPLQVFFHNDQPNPKSTSTKTDIDYKECFREYKSLSNIYKAEATKQLNDSTENAIIDSIDNFFSFKINKGMEKLDNMCEYLLTELKHEKKLNISIIGYSSALHSDMYNFSLSERRISSIINYIRKWNNGELNYYLTHIANDSIPYLFIKTLPMGKIGSKSDNPKSLIERRRSIYNIDAMYERRVEVKLIEIRK